MTATFTPNEASILRVLHLANGWVSQETLIRATWGDAEADDAELFMATRHTLRVNVSRIRRKLAPRRRIPARSESESAEDLSACSGAESFGDAESRSQPG